MPTRAHLVDAALLVSLGLLVVWAHRWVSAVGG